MWSWWILFYVAVAEILYKIHRLTVVEYGKFRMEFAPPKKDAGANSQKQRQLRPSRAKKQIKK